VTETGGEARPRSISVTEPVAGATPVTSPDALTLMTDVGAALYMIFALATVTPFTSRPTVVNCNVSPTAIVCFGAVMNTGQT